MSDTIHAACGTTPGGAMSLCADPSIEPAVAEARRDAARLHKAFDRGLGDTDAAVRHRVARATGVPESYLRRLHQRARDMDDVSGKWARLLRLACEALDRSAERAATHQETLDDETLAIRRELAARASQPLRGPRQESFLQELESDRTLDWPHP